MRATLTRTALASAIALAVVGFIEADSLHGELLKGGIALQFFLDDGAQIESGDLQNLQGLPELRCENQRLGLSLPKILTKSGPAHRDEKRRGSSQMGVREESDGTTGSRTPKSSLR